jgi:hypothetical protein
VIETLRQLCMLYGVRGYFDTGDGLTGIRNKGVVLWFRCYTRQGYLRVGSTDRAPRSAYHRVR